MNAYDVLKEHHIVIKGLGRKVSEAPVNSEERHALFDEMLMELDIHFRIEDDLYYPALGAATKLIAVAHAEHRQVVDQLSVLLKTPQSAQRYEEEWNSFKTVLEAHADEEERDLIPAPPGGEDHRRGARGAGQRNGRPHGAIAWFHPAQAAYQGAGGVGACAVGGQRG